MPQMKLNARQVETAKPKDKPYKLADSGGMYLEVFPNGTKSWRMKYRIAGKGNQIFAVQKSVKDVWREAAISDASYYNWKVKFAVWKPLILS